MSNWEVTFVPDEDYEEEFYDLGTLPNLTFVFKQSKIQFSFMFRLHNFRDVDKIEDFVHSMKKNKYNSFFLIESDYRCIFFSTNMGKTTLSIYADNDLNSGESTIIVPNEICLPVFKI